MPTRKQRRREAKSKRHEYEFVYVDDEGNELDLPDEERADGKKERAERRNGSKPATKAKQPQRGGRQARVPQAPSWQRAVRRAVLLGIVVLVLFGMTSKGDYKAAVPLAVVYTALFIPFTYWIDRFVYRRYQAKHGGEPTKKR